jgi:hypothetical protein
VQYCGAAIYDQIKSNRKFMTSLQSWPHFERAVCDGNCVFQVATSWGSRDKFGDWVVFKTSEKCKPNINELDFL